MLSSVPERPDFVHVVRLQEVSVVAMKTRCAILSDGVHVSGVCKVATNPTGKAKNSYVKFGISLLIQNPYKRRRPMLTNAQIVQDTLTSSLQSLTLSTVSSGHWGPSPC